MRQSRPEKVPMWLERAGRCCNTWTESSLKAASCRGLTAKSRVEWKEECLMAVPELKNDDETEIEVIY